MIGTPLSSLCFKEILPVQIGKYQPPTSPNLKLYKTPLMEGKLVLGGKIGIDMELSPSFLLVHKAHFKNLKNPKKLSVNKDVFFTKN